MVIMQLIISFHGRVYPLDTGITSYWQIQAVILRRVIYWHQMSFCIKWQERNEEQDLIIVDRYLVLGFLTDKERSHKVAEWAYVQGKK